MKNIFRKISRPAIFVLALTIGFAGFAHAAIPDTQGVIHGCYRSGGILANGPLRIIDSDNQSCNANETELTWNQAGPQGPPGPSGTGSTVSKRLNLSAPYIGPGHDDIIDAEFITLPGFGEVTVSCPGVSGKYHNTSGKTVYISPGPGPNNEVAVPNGGAYSPIQGSSSTPASFLFSHGSDTESSAGVLTFRGETTFTETAADCIFAAFANFDQ